MRNKAIGYLANGFGIISNNNKKLWKKVSIKEPEISKYNQPKLYEQEKIYIFKQKRKSNTITAIRL